MVVIWVTRTGGPAILADETLAALVAALGGVVAPVILLWLILLMCSREGTGSEITARLDRLAAPDPSGDARVQTMAAALRRQADLASEATEYSIAAVDAARERLADTARENDVSLDRRAEVLRNVAEEANSWAMAGTAAPDERARSLVRATETIAYHHRDLVVGLERRGELFDAHVGEAAQWAREVSLIIRDQAELMMRAISLAETRGREASLALEAEAGRFDAALDALDGRISRLDDIVGCDVDRVEAAADVIGKSLVRHRREHRPTRRPGGSRRPSVWRRRRDRPARPSTGTAASSPDGHRLWPRPAPRRETA